MSDDVCGLNGCEQPVRRSVIAGEQRGIRLTLCIDCADEVTDRWARYD